MIHCDFLVPDYYPSFLCKGSECRNCCCDGWTITISQKEYFNLMNLNVSKGMKEKIDAFVSPLNDATPDRYARINLNYKGECPLRREDGWCALQCEVGEEKIPSVCRYYPRAPRLYPTPFCCISNSCEWVIEKLMKQKDKIKLVHKELSFVFDSTEPAEIPDYKDGLSKQCGEIIQDISLPLLKRLKDIKNLLGVNKNYEDYLTPAIDKLREIYRRSFSIGDYLQVKRDNLSLEERTDYLNKNIPNFNRGLSSILFNHLIFMRFPYLEDDISLENAYPGLLLLLSFWTELAYQNEDKSNPNWFIDLTSRLFRVIEHSDFYLISLEILNRLVK